MSLPASIVVCNFEQESEIELGVDGEIVLSNYGRKTLDRRFAPYEVAVIKL